MSQQLKFFELSNEEVHSTSLFGMKTGWLEAFTKQVKNYYECKPKIKTLSLFSGCGGLDIGFHDAGFNIVECVEIEKDFAKTLAKNTGPGKYLGHTDVNCTDIKNYTTDNKVDFIIGGPPCQTFSSAGRRASGVMGTTDSKGMLFEEYVRLLKKLEPAGFLFENVYGILGAQKGQAWEDIKQAFCEAGYKLHFRILDAADYGVPQHRERLIIIGLKHGTFQFPRPTHGPDSPEGTGHFSAKEALKGVETSSNRKDRLGGTFGHLLEDIPPGLNYSFYTEKMGHPNPVFGWRSKFSDFLYKADSERPVRTLKAQGGQYTGPFHWNSRPFDINELKRLQTIPDEYKLAGGKSRMIHQIGNSVPPQLARVLACAIQEQVFKNGSPAPLYYLKEDEQLSFRKRKRELTKIYKEKAKEAISTRYSGNNTHSNNIKNEELYFNFCKKLVVEESPSGDFFGVAKCINDELIIDVTHRSQVNKNTGTIVLESEDTWALKYKRVKISWSEATISGLSSAWKFFEFILKKNKIKSDLVQLGGYYQYKPLLNIVWITPDNFCCDLNNLKKITECGLFRKLISFSELKKRLDLLDSEALEFLRRIKKLGWDVRTKNTNSMIPDGKILIPYEFPTLYIKSVQYKKEL